MQPSAAQAQPTRLLNNGRELDLSNLYFYRARCSGDGNLYAYVDTDPINYGLKVKPDPPDNDKPRPCVDQS